MVRRHVYDGERCIHCNVNKYDCYCENDECCNEREPMTYTSEAPPGVDCPACGRTWDQCSDMSFRGRDACCAACDQVGRGLNHRAPMAGSLR